MKRLAALAPALLAATPALAGGVDRSAHNISPLFESGSYAELSFGHVTPNVSGGLILAPSVVSGDASNAYSLWSFAYKTDLGPRTSIALIFDQPYGAQIDYPDGTGYFAQGAYANLDTNAASLILRQRFDGGFAVHGGLRYQSMRAGASIPYVASYTAQTETGYDAGYLLGASYERPEIALRVALTYFSEISHDLDTVETSSFPTVYSTTNITTPQSVNLDFQTGVAPDTLLFGQIRWADWSTFDIRPTSYATITGGGNPAVGQSLVSYNNDRMTYTIGLGRRLNDTWSIAGSVTHEPQNGDIASNLGPYDGYTAVGLGGTYTKDRLKISGGLRYIWIGDAGTRADLTPPEPDTSFTGNSGWGVGLKVSYSY